MKNNISWSLLIVFSLLPHGFAQEPQHQQPQYNPNQQQLTASSLCLKELATHQTDKTKPSDYCQKLRFAAAIAGEQLTSPRDHQTTNDKRITCVRKAGYTLDYNDCLQVLNRYNRVLDAEQLMFQQQQFRVGLGTQSSSKKVAERVAEGDGQNAVIDATIENNKRLEGMNKEQVAVYSTAVMWLAEGIKNWQSAGQKSILKLCGQKKDFASHALATEGINCQDALLEVASSNKSEAFANQSARGQFLLASAELSKKAIEASIRAGNLNNVTKKIADAQQAAEDDFPENSLDHCVINPSSKDCINKTGGRSATYSNFQGSKFAVGNSAGGAFSGITDKAPEFGEIGADTNLQDKVSDVPSPFGEEAKKANEILNPAAKASIQATGGEGGGGGGGGAGGGFGGGGAALGNDLQGSKDDENKEKEIKPGSFTGNYANTGSAKFEAVRASKDDANPFSSLFNSENSGSGGIEEEYREIASGDIDGPGSELFRKISLKYGKVYQDKRIEANNLE